MRLANCSLVEVLIVTVIVDVVGPPPLTKPQFAIKLTLKYVLTTIGCMHGLASLDILATVALSGPGLTTHELIWTSLLLKFL